MRFLWSIALVAGCVVGRPPSFSAGDRWVFPLVDPLDDDRLVTPVTIGGKGPFLFALDPDSPTTVVDREVLALGEFRAEQHNRVVDENDIGHPAFFATAINLKIGNLRISQMPVLASANGVFDSPRRRIVGIIGRDILVDSVVFGFDRERGIAWLETKDVFKAPAGATILDYYKNNDAVSRHLVDVTVGGKTFPMHVDLGDVPSQLRGQHWQAAGLAGVARPTTLIDFYGSRRTENVMATGTFEIRGLRSQVGIVPYNDKRWISGILEGAVGLDFFRPYTVVTDWDERRIFVTPREVSPETAAARLARWDGIACGDHCGEVQIGMERGIVGAHVTRDASTVDRELELVFTAKRPDGIALPALHASFPAGSRELANTVDPQYLGSTFTLVDASPFPFPCPGGCIVSALPVDP